jgi:hypothetical protein
LIDTKLLNESVYDVLETLTTIPLVIENQKITPTAPTYFTYKFKSWQQVGQIHQSRTDSTLESTTTVRSFWKACLQITGIGQDSESETLTLATRLEKTSTIDRFESLGIAYMYKDPIKNVPRLLSTGWEERHILEVYVNLILVDTDTTGYIETAEVEGTIYDEGSEVIYNHTWIIEATP